MEYNFQEKVIYCEKKIPKVFSDKIGELKDYQIKLHIDESV